jgi:hypothetical protein
VNPRKKCPSDLIKLNEEKQNIMLPIRTKVLGSCNLRRHQKLVVKIKSTFEIAKMCIICAGVIELLIRKMNLIIISSNKLPVG